MFNFIAYFVFNYSDLIPVAFDLNNRLQYKCSTKASQNNTKDVKNSKICEIVLFDKPNQLKMNGKDLRSIRKKLGYTQQEFADLLKYSLSAIQKWETDRRVIDDYTAGVIKQLEKNAGKKHHKAAQEISEQKELSSEFKGTPYYDVDFAGGWSSEEVFVNQLPSFYITSPDFEKAEFACNLIGQSISRRIPNRAVLGLRQIRDWEMYFPTNEVYAVLMKNDLRTVKIVKRSEKDGFLTLIPDPLPEFNQTIYEPEEVPVSFVAKMFQVVAWAQFERVAM